MLAEGNKGEGEEEIGVAETQKEGKGEGVKRPKAKRVDAKQFDCDQCSKSLASAKGLREHIARVHTAERLFKCPLCTAAHALKRDLDVHISKQHTNRWTSVFLCSICHVEFSTKARVTNHQKTAHSGDSTASKKCDACGVFMVTEAALFRHKVERHESKCIFSCSVCPMFKASTKAALIIHIEAMHCGGLPFAAANAALGVVGEQTEPATDSNLCPVSSGLKVAVDAVDPTPVSIESEQQRPALATVNVKHVGTQTCAVVETNYNYSKGFGGGGGHRLMQTNGGGVQQRDDDEEDDDNGGINLFGGGYSDDEEDDDDDDAGSLMEMIDDRDDDEISEHEDDDEEEEEEEDEDSCSPFAQSLSRKRVRTCSRRILDDEDDDDEDIIYGPESGNLPTPTARRGIVSSTILNALGRGRLWHSFK